MKKLKRSIREIIPWAPLVVLLIVIFREWFSVGLISSGDYPFFFQENFDERLTWPLAWKEHYNIPFLAQWPHELLTGFLSKMGFNFTMIERIAWFWPFLIISIFSSCFLARTLFPQARFLHFSAPVIYLFNTYILMVINGGQVGIASSYAIAPLVFSLFLRSIANEKIENKIISGVALSVQIICDPRIALVTLGAIFLYSVLSYKLILRKYVNLFFLPLIVTLGLHFYWVFPTLLVGKSPLPAGYGEPDWIGFLSFASFSNTISLLHPNWPENIFGKTYFMKPEFLGIPILAYSSLLFINLKLKTPHSVLQCKTSRGRQNFNILFFSLLGLFGAFLGKGSTPPFGEIYTMLFKYLPGMNLFRDPTKFYILVALSYSILIPFSLHQINSYLSSKFKVQSSKLQLKVKNYLPDLFLLLITCYLLLLIKPAWTGQLGGTFRTKEVPKEYAKLKDFIHSQEDFSRTLWIPTQQRFGFSDYNHPAVSAESFFNSNDPFVIINHLNSERTEEKLRDFSVKYIVVPYDTEKELFLTERKYDKEKKQRIEEGLGKISWLEKKYLFPNIAIFEIKNPKDHFWLEGQKGKVSYKMANPTKYQVDGETVTLESYLIFSERFDSFWTLRLDSKIIPSRQKEDLMNSFNVPLSGRWKGTVEYLPQKYVNLSLIVSGFAILMTMIALAYSHVKKI